MGVRYVASEARIGSLRYWGVWDAENQKLVNQTREELRDTKQEAQQDADRLNNPA